MKNRFNSSVILWLLLLPVMGAMAQKDSLPTSPKVKAYKPEIFTSGFIDIVNNGQLNASARFVRLLIGEPGKLALPLSLYSGVSANAFQGPGNINGPSNEQLINNYINPMSGIVNLSVDGIWYKRPP